MSLKLLARIRAWLLVVMLLSVLAAVAIMSSWFIAEDEFGEEWVFTAMLSTVFSFSALLCVNVLCRSRHRQVMWIGVGASLVAFTIWQPVMWIDWWRIGMSSRQYVLAGTISSVVAGWCALFAIFASFTRASLAARIAMYLTLGLAAVEGGMITIAAHVEPFNDAFWAFFGILSMFTACGFLASIALGMMLRVQSTGARESIGRHIKIQLTCPRCASPQSLTTGESRCQACGLHFEINVEEPVCECGYQLYKLTGDTCPECGRKITDADRWAVHVEKTTEPGIVCD